MTLDVKIIIVFLCICMMTLEVSSGIWSSDKLDEKVMTPARARDIRAKARFHFKKANLAQEKMHEAERLGDVDMYEKNLSIMRQEDLKMVIAGEEYEEIRDFLESQIYTGQLEIEGFEKMYEKGTAASILDHLTFRAKY